jgi:hypothetical protein
MMKAHLTRFALTLAAAAILIFAAAAPAAAETQSFRTQSPFAVFVPCANGGLGELVEGIAKEHDVFGLTADSAGGFHVHAQGTLQGVGIGDVTGDTYQFHQDFPDFIVDQANLTAGGASNFSFDINVAVIGMGAAPNFTMDFRVQGTTDANGVVTMAKTFVSASCN